MDASERSGRSKATKSASPKRRSQRVSDEEAGPFQREVVSSIQPERVASQAEVYAPTVSSAPAAPVEDADSAPAEEATSGPLPPPDSRFLAQLGGARLFVSTGDGRPLDLGVEALVVSTDFQANFSGGLASHVREVLGEEVWSVFEGKVRSTLGNNPLRPDRPVLVQVQPRARPPLTLVAATPWVARTESASLEGVEIAVGAVLARAGSRGLRHVAIPLLGARGGGLPPVQVVRSVLAVAQRALPATPGIRELTVLSQEEDAYDEAIALFTRVPQRFANDLPGGEDLLDVASEVQALTDILLLRSLQPPLAVGILGGWGTGKSFAMDLMRRHIQRIRGLPPNGGWDGQGADQYVGHIYPITFDAWTYAKSNLWASLMQTIFLELSRQVHLERRIRQRLGESPDPELEGRLWRAFQSVSNRDREALLDQEDLVRHFEALSAPGAQLDSEAGKALWEAVATLKQEQQEVLATKQDELATVSRQLEEKKAELAQEVEQDLESKAYRIAWEGASEGLQTIIREALAATQGSSKVSESGAAVKDFLGLVGRDAASVPLRAGNLWRAVRRNPVVASSAILVFATLAGLGGWLASHQQVREAAVAWVGSGLTSLVAVLQAAKSWRTQVASIWNCLEREVRTAEARVEKEREAILQKKLEEPVTAKDLRELTEKRQRLESEIQRLRQQIGFTADYVSVADLVQARLRKAEYEGELGLLHRVQRDLEELSDALCLAAGHPHFDKLRAQFPRGPARIVLFIDDLDRCPPDRVVEVLEAVQLLVKTPLFVVVLAMDVRYITRALEKVYKDILLRHGNPNGLDYIEKIIQLPYSVRPLDAAHVERFLRAQMEVEAVAEEETGVGLDVAGGQASVQGGSGLPEPEMEEAEPITAEVVTFTAVELGWIKCCCQRLPLTPRAVKRIVNALKLLKIVWFRPNRHLRPEPAVQESFVALLALSAAYPNGMRSLFTDLSRQVREAPSPLALQGILAGLVPALREQLSDDEVTGLEAGLNLIPIEAAAGPGLWATLELVRSLSFVAEIGYDPADERVHGEETKRG